MNVSDLEELVLQMDPNGPEYQLIKVFDPAVNAYGFIYVWRRGNVDIRIDTVSLRPKYEGEVVKNEWRPLGTFMPTPPEHSRWRRDESGLLIKDVVKNGRLHDYEMKLYSFEKERAERLFLTDRGPEAPEYLTDHFSHREREILVGLRRT